MTHNYDNIILEHETKVRGRRLAFVRALSAIGILLGMALLAWMFRN